MPRVVQFPNWNTNPYLNLLMLEPRANGWTHSGGTSVADLLRRIPSLRKGDVLHVQWTSPFAEGVKTESQYRERILAFEDELAAARRRGVKVLWTVHNLIAHDSDFFRPEVQLAESLARHADRIIILNAFTEVASRDLYKLPAKKLVRIPHSSYVGVYPPRSNRVSVQRQLGIPAGLKTVGMVGAIRPYKGVGAFLDAARIAAQHLPRLGVVMAGATSQWALTEVEAHMPHGLPVFRRHVTLTDADIAMWMSACDVLVLPYLGILNSGSMHLAATFGVPVVLPRLAHLEAEYSDQPWVIFFEDVAREDRPSAVAEAMIEALRVGPSVRDAALEFAAAFTPFDMSVQYADILDDL